MNGFEPNQLLAMQMSGGDMVLGVLHINYLQQEVRNSNDRAVYAQQLPPSSQPPSGSSGSPHTITKPKSTTKNLRSRVIMWEQADAAAKSQMKDELCTWMFDGLTKAMKEVKAKAKGEAWAPFSDTIQKKNEKAAKYYIKNQSDYSEALYQIKTQFEFFFTSRFNDEDLTNPTWSTVGANFPNAARRETATGEKRRWVRLFNYLKDTEGCSENWMTFYNEAMIHRFYRIRGEGIPVEFTSKTYVKRFRWLYRNFFAENAPKSIRSDLSPKTIKDLDWYNAFAEQAGLVPNRHN